MSATSAPIRRASPARSCSASRTRTLFPLIFMRENCADMAIAEEDVEEGVHRWQQGAADHRHAFFHRVHRPHQPPRARARARERRAHGARHRLPAGAVGPHQARRRRDALRALRHRDRASAAHPARCSTSSSARSRNSTSPAAAPTSWRRCAAVRAVTPAMLRGQARPDGLRGHRRRDSALARRRFQRPRRRGRGAQRARRRRRVFRRLPVGLGARRGLRRLLPLRQRLRRAGRLAPRLRAGDADPRRARLLSRQRRQHPAPRPGCRADPAASRHGAAHAARRSAAPSLSTIAISSSSWRRRRERASRGCRS